MDTFKQYFGSSKKETLNEKGMKPAASNVLWDPYAGTKNRTEIPFDKDLEALDKYYTRAIESRTPFEIRSMYVEKIEFNKQEFLEIVYKFDIQDMDLKDYLLSFELDRKGYKKIESILKAINPCEVYFYREYKNSPYHLHVRFSGIRIP